MPELYQSLSHSRWNCKYHIVFVPKRRQHKLFGEIRCKLGPIFHELARQKECCIIEGHIGGRAAFDGGHGRKPGHDRLCWLMSKRFKIRS